jgi:membrane-associated phospholipid phosphatase
VRGEWTRDGDRATDYIEPFGNGKYMAPALGAYYLYGSVAEDERAMRVGMLGFEAYVVSGITVNILKYATHRHRPITGDPHNTWDGPSFVSDNLSFPSGHASSAFSVAAVVASEYRDNVVVNVASYGIATLVALSRIYDDKHWASDAFLGSAIGYATGKAIYKWRSDTSGEGLVIYPVPLHDGGAVFVSFGF